LASIPPRVVFPSNFGFDPLYGFRENLDKKREKEQCENIRPPVTA